jgi:hypothetical protein
VKDQVTWILAGVLAGSVAAAADQPAYTPAPVAVTTTVTAPITLDSLGAPLDQRLPDERDYAPADPAAPGLARARLRPFRVQTTAPRESLETPAPAPGGSGWVDTAVGSVPRLPAYTVTDTHLAVFRPRDLYTRPGMIARSYHDHPGLLWGNPFHSNDGAAYDAFQEDDWNATKSDYWQTAFAMALGGDPAEGRFIVDAVSDEDVRLRAETNAPNIPTNDQFQVGELNPDTKVLELAQVPLDIPLVRVKW